MDDVIEAWGAAPGKLFVNDRNEIVLATLQAGNVVVLIQPPRGFGENPVAIYHDPDLAPSHHYLAAYRWVEHGFGAHAVVHLGKHGSMEWLPGKNAALSASCATDAAIGNLPLIYPFLVNDPGEGAQAKRRAHATIVDHLVPPMARAESYGDIARLEQLLDEHANIAAMDPAKLPAIRAEIWTLMHAAEMHRDLGPRRAPGRRGVRRLHPARRRLAVRDQGRPDPRRSARARPGARGRGAGQPGARDPAGGPGLGRRDGRGSRAALGARAHRGWRAVQRRRRHRGRGAGARGGHGEGGLEPGGRRRPARRPDRRAACSGSPPSRSCRDSTPPPTSSTPCCTPSTAASSRPGRPARRCAGSSTCCPPAATSTPSTRGPSRPGWRTTPASRWPTRSCSATSTRPASYPRSVGLSVWGTSAMRTSGDDIAEVLALIGVRPAWDEASRRVNGLDSRYRWTSWAGPRIDVTVRISGFFRDAFPHVIAMLDDAVRLVAELDEPDGAELRPRTRAGRSRRARRPAPRHHAHLRLGARLVRRGHPAGRRGRQLARRQGPRRGLHAVGRLRLRPRPRRRSRRRRHAHQLPAHRRRRQEHRHPRARHRRLRRLLPVPRRHGRHGACADRLRPQGVRRRLHVAGRRAHPHAVGGDGSRVPRPRRQPALDRRDAAARLQGRVRARRHGRLPVRLRRHGRRRPRLDVRDAGQGVRARRGQPGVHEEVEPLGAARHRRAARRGGRPRAVGRPRPGDRRRDAAGLPRHRGRPGGPTDERSGSSGSGRAVSTR